MAGTPAPQFIPEPFANLQTGSYLNYPIPDAPPSSPANLACWQLGFQSITMQPEIGGGLPPFGQDFNGILKTVTTHTYALQAGQWYLYNNSFATSISGYEEGALLAMVDGTGLWMNIQSSGGNSTNPDSDGSNVDWWPAISYGIANLTGLTGGTVVVPPSESKKPVIALNGALTSNLTIELPAQVQFWLINNNTTGSFTTTVKTASGTGVTVPQGGPGSPTGVWSDGTNIYLSTAPLAVPIAQAATPLTLVERTNLGYIFGVYFNGSTALENPTIGAIIVQNTAADGYFRKISQANFRLQLFASPAFTGVPTAPTPAAGDNSTKVATTAFVNAGGNAGTGGSGTSGGWWRKNPDGTITQGGTYSYGGVVSTQIVPFVVPFANAVLQVIQGSSVGGFTPGWNASLSGNTLSQFVAQFNGMGGTSQTCYWQATGR
jgi:hypothetical protein